MQALPQSRQKTMFNCYYSATDKELNLAAAGIVPKNTAGLYGTSRRGGNTTVTTVFIKIHHIARIYYLPIMQVNWTIGFLDSCWKQGEKMAHLSHQEALS